ncbi:MAG: alpha/beta hydrolase [Deltaproteobacteria bacterium]|nr:alpha/beta hydrolase [Deltaproteobacteria bacterium]
MDNYSKLDNDLITNFLFHPRKGNVPSKGLDLRIPVESYEIGAKFFNSGENNPTILFFHGNGEIVSDYNDIGEYYLNENINFFAVDYRGYGTSSGNPNASTTIKDSILVFDYVKNYLKENKITGKLYVMGRSLGSASAIEIAAKHENDLDGLIIESGFAYTVPLLKVLGISGLDIIEEEGFNNLKKIEYYKKKLLVIHAENDHIIPFSDGEDLYRGCASEDKGLIKIEKADHNTIFYYGMEKYMDAVNKFIKN